MTTDIVERLRQYEAFDDCSQEEIENLREAASEITRLRAEVEALRADAESWRRYCAMQRDAAMKEPTP